MVIMLTFYSRVVSVGELALNELQRQSRLSDPCI